MGPGLASAFILVASISCVAKTRSSVQNQVRWSASGIFLRERNFSIPRRHGSPTVYPGSLDAFSLVRGAYARRALAEDGQEKEALSKTEWPAEMLGDNEWSDYVSAVKIRHEGVKSCAGLRTPHGGNPTKVIANGALYAKDIRKMSSYTRLGEAYKGPRIMIWVAKNGLGNVVRGFLTTFFYAFLSGRQLVRSEEGSHGKVMRSLCHGFMCPYVDVLHFRGRLPRWTMNICHRNLVQTLGEVRPIVVGDCDVLLKFWAYNDTLRQCVLDSFGCADEWCVLSRAELLLLGSPAWSLAQVIDESMVLMPALGTSLGPSSGLERRGLRQSEGQSVNLPVKAVADSHSAWPSERSFRFAPEVISPSPLPGDENAQPHHEPWPKKLSVMQAVECLSGVVRSDGITGLNCTPNLKRRALQDKDQLLRLPKGGRKPKEKMAWVRNIANLFLRRKEEATGGSGGALSTSEAKAELPRGLRLKFDLGLHIRTLYRCVEKSASGPGCKAGGVEHAAAAAGFSTELRKFVYSFDWHCLSNLLIFLHKLRFPAQGDGAQDEPKERDPLFATAEARRQLGDFLEHSSKFSMAKKNAFSMWTVDKAKYVAEELSKNAGFPSGGKKLSIFLATDSEVLRPLFVEFLRPFGHVAYSEGHVVHLDRGTSDENKRLPTVAEFFLLSKASVSVSFTRRLSSFLQHAAMYGNGTLLSRGGSGGCRFFADHIAETPSSP